MKKYIFIPSIIIASALLLINIASLFSKTGILFVKEERERGAVSVVSIDKSVKKFKKRIIYDIDVDGLSFLSSSVVKKHLISRIGGRLSPKDVRNEIQRLKRKFNLLKISVGAEKFERGVNLRYRFREGEYISRDKFANFEGKNVTAVEFHGIYKIKRNNLPPLLTVKNESFSLSGLENDVRVLLREHGIYIYGVRPVKDGDGVRIVFSMKDEFLFNYDSLKNYGGEKIKSVKIKGLEPEVSEIVREKMLIRPGKELLLSSLEQDIHIFYGHDIAETVVKAKKKNDGLDIVFKCTPGKLTGISRHEGKVINKIEFKGLIEQTGGVSIERENPAKLTWDMLTKAGENFYVSTLKNDIDRISSSPDILVDDVKVRDNNPGVTIEIKCRKIPTIIEPEIELKFKNKKVTKNIFLNHLRRPLKNVSSGTLEADVETTVGHYLNQSVLVQDIKYLYTKYKFKNITVELEKDGEGVSVIYLCEERPVIDSIEFFGLDEFAEMDFTETLLMKEGEVFREDNLEGSIRQIKTKYASEGFNVQIDSKILPVEGENAVKVRLIIDEGDEILIKKIKFFGAKKIHPDELRSLMETDEDGIFSDGSFKIDIFEKDRAKILNFYKQEGFLGASIHYKKELHWDNPEKKETRVYYLLITVNEGERSYFDSYKISFWGRRQTFGQVQGPLNEESLDRYKGEKISRVRILGIDEKLAVNIVKKLYSKAGAVFKVKKFESDLEVFYKDKWKTNNDEIIFNVTTSMDQDKEGVVIYFYCQTFGKGAVIKEITFSGIEKKYHGLLLKVLKSTPGQTLKGQAVHDDLNVLRKKLGVSKIFPLVSGGKDAYITFQVAEANPGIPLNRKEYKKYKDLPVAAVDVYGAKADKLPLSGFAGKKVNFKTLKAGINNYISASNLSTVDAKMITGDRGIYVVLYAEGQKGKVRLTASNADKYKRKKVSKIHYNGLSLYSRRDIKSHFKFDTKVPFLYNDLKAALKTLKNDLNIKKVDVTLEETPGGIELFLDITEGKPGREFPGGNAGRLNGYTIDKIMVFGLENISQQKFRSKLDLKEKYDIFNAEVLTNKISILKREMHLFGIKAYLKTRKKKKVELRFYCNELPEGEKIVRTEFRDLTNAEISNLPELQTEAGKKLSSRKLQEDMKALYRHGRYLSIYPRIFKYQDGVIVIFHFEKAEGQNVKEIQFRYFIKKRELQSAFVKKEEKPLTMKQLRAAINTQKGDVLSLEKLEDDREALKELVGRYKVSYDLIREKDGVRVEFFKTVYTEKQIKNLLELENGGVFNNTQYMMDRQNVGILYSSRGYIFAKLNDKRYEATEVREVINEDGNKETRKYHSVEFNIVEGTKAYIEEIIIKGMTKTKKHVIKREIIIKEGELFDSRKVQISREKIYNLGYFKQVNVDLRQGSKPGFMRLIVEVEEQPSGTISLGGGYGTTSGFSIFADLAENNLMGNGQRVGLKLEYGPLRSAVTLSFYERWLLGYPIGFSASVFYQLYKIQSTSLFTNSSDQAEYEKQSVGYSLGLSYRFWYHYVIGTTWSHAFKRYLNPTGNSTDEVFLAVARGQQEKRTQSFYAYRDSKNNYLNPTSGSRVGVKMSITGGMILKGDDHFIKYEPEAYFYFSPFHLPFLKTHPCVFEFRGNATFTVGPWFKNSVENMSSNEENQWLEAEDRMYIGGPETLRAWDYYDIDFPKSWRNVGMFHRILYGAEFRIPIHPQMLWVAFFFDAGSLFTDSFWEARVNDTIKEIIDLDKESGELKSLDQIYSDRSQILPYFRYSYGFGFRIQIPMMPLRFWFGKKMIYDDSFKTISGFQFQFAIGDMRF